MHPTRRDAQCAHVACLAEDDEVKYRARPIGRDDASIVPYK